MEKLLTGAVDARNNLASLVRRLEQDTHLLQGTRKVSGARVAASIDELAPGRLTRTDVDGLLTVLVQHGFLVPSNGTRGPLLAGRYPPASDKIRYRLDRRGTFPKGILPSPRVPSVAALSDDDGRSEASEFSAPPRSSSLSSLSSSSSSSSSSSAASNGASSSSSSSSSPSVVHAPLPQPNVVRNLSDDLAQVAASSLSSSVSSSSSSSSPQSTWASAVSISGVLACLAYARADVWLHSVLLVVALFAGVVASAYHRKTTSTPPPRGRRPLAMISSSSSSSLSSSSSAAAATAATTTTTTSAPPASSLPPSSASPSADASPAASAATAAALPTIAHKNYTYRGPFPDRFATCARMVELSLRDSGGLDWAVATASIGGLGRLAPGASGRVLRTWVDGSRFAKFRLDLVLPFPLRFVMRCCNEERLDWDNALSRIDVLRPCSDECAIELYATRKQFGISPRAFVDTKWSIDFEDGATWSFSASRPLNLPVPGDAVARLPGAHTRGVNHPGSAWVFEPVKTDGAGIGGGGEQEGGTRMSQVIHSDLRGWMPPSLVNASMNTHLNGFAKKLVAYAAKQWRAR